MYFLQQLHEHEIKEAFFIFFLNIGSEALISMWIPKGAAIIWDPTLIRGNTVSLFSNAEGVSSLFGLSINYPVTF